MLNFAVVDHICRSLVFLFFFLTMLFYWSVNPHLAEQNFSQKIGFWMFILSGYPAECFWTFGTCGFVILGWLVQCVVSVIISAQDVTACKNLVNWNRLPLWMVFENSKMFIFLVSGKNEVCVLPPFSTRNGKPVRFSFGASVGKISLFVFLEWMRKSLNSP